MMDSKLKWATLAVGLAAVLTLGACKKKVSSPPPPPPPPPAPTASLKATPDTIQRGGSSTLTWTTSNATDINIEGIGSVEATGSESVSPAQSTTYRLVAKGAGGLQDAVARVTVTEPPPPPPPARPSPTDEELFRLNIKNLFFDFDKYNIRPDQEQALQENARFLVQHPNIRFTLEGHCDERGSIEYNLALGDNRANSVKQALVTAGVNADRIHTISYGKERPICTEHNEECWQQNRRAHFVYQE